MASHAPRAPRAKAVPGWKYLGGSTRSYQNESTGERISRRQYDEHYGRLKAQGYRSNEAQRKARKAAKIGIVQGIDTSPARGRRARYVVNTPAELAERLKRAPWIKGVAAMRFGILFLDPVLPYDDFQIDPLVRIIVFVRAKVVGIQGYRAPSIEAATAPFTAVIERAFPRMVKNLSRLVIAHSNGFFFSPREGTYRWLATASAVRLPYLGRQQQKYFEQYRRLDYPLSLVMLEAMIARELPGARDSLGK